MAKNILLDKIYETMVFRHQTIEQNSNPSEKETNEVSSRIALAYYQGRVSRQQPWDSGLKQSMVVSLS